MRLLQLSTTPTEIIDLHPNVTVVSGLDEDSRQVLVHTVLGLARASSGGSLGLLEAHGVLFDLNDDMLGVLDVAADGLEPVVTRDELPTAPNDPRARERLSAQRAVGEIEERCAAARDDQRRMKSALDAAAARLARARRNATEAEAGPAERIRLIDDLTAQLDHVDERRRRLLEAQAASGPAIDAAQARRLEVDEATIDVRSRHQETVLRCSELAGRLDEARLALDPAAVREADAASEELARVTAAVEAERAAERARGEAPPEDEEPPAERLARVQVQIEAIEKRLLSFLPAEARGVADAVARLRARLDGELVASPAALELAEQLEVVEADLTATSGVGTTSADLATARARLDAARAALTEAEQAVRNPQLDRSLVNRLELAHADVLEAIDKADGRFAGGRAQRRVDAARAAEQVLLDELGFTSYSDYMMGNSLLNVDPEKEAILDAARGALASAEDEWRLLDAEMEAELARAARMERRRRLLDEARALLGRSVSASTVADELRAVRVPASVPPELVDDLQRTLDEAGVAVGGEDLSRDELLLVAEAWLAEADQSTHREDKLRRELAALSEERLDALAAVEADEARRAALGGPLPEEERAARLAAAQEAAELAEGRRRHHLDAEAVVGALTAELAAASEEERLAAAAAAEAEAAVAEAAQHAVQVATDAVHNVEELEALNLTELDANEHLQSLSDHEYSSPEELAKEVAEAEVAFAAADDRFQVAVGAVQALELERQEARALASSLQDLPGEVDEGSIADEIEWYLLARVAAQRAVCLGGSLPLLLDGALDGLDEQQLAHVLGRLERMADAVQVIVVSDDPRAAAWAVSAGQERAAVVHPQPA